MRFRRIGTAAACVALFASACAGDAGNTGAEAASTASEDAGSGEPSARLAMILPGPIQDADYNAIAYESLDHLEQELGIETAFSEQVAVADAERVAREYIADGNDIIAFHGGQFLTVVQKLAGEFPDTVFIAESSGDMPDQPANVWNIARYFAPGFYVQGALAALQSEKGKIAFLGGIDIPDYKAGANAMFAGARAVRPDVELVFSFNGDQNDAVKGRQSADALINQGADVLVLGVNNAIYGVAEAAQSAGEPVYMTSNFTDKESVAPELFLNSMLWDFGGAFEEAITGILAGETSGVVRMDPASGYIRLSPLYNVDDEVRSQINDLFQQIVDGTVDVPNKTDEVILP
jgi:basic membrane protein A